MKRSTERILTTHTGSLPRPPHLTEQLERADHHQLSGDELQSLGTEVREAVMDTVRKQRSSRVDVVGDGEMSKIGYSTYVKERLTGFEGESQMPAPTDLMEYPEVGQAVLGALTIEMPACSGPVEFTGADAVQADIENLRAAVDAAGAEEAFISAASPGVIGLFLPNQHYSDDEEYLFALADAMKHEYDAIADAGFILQLDCPDLAMGRHIQFGQESVEEFRKQAELHINAFNHATRDIDPDNLRMHLCWGNYDGPHHHDVDLSEIVDIILKSRASALLLEAANPRHEHEYHVFENVSLPDDKVLIPGVIDSTNNYIEHPELVAERLVRYGKIVGPERVIAGSDCGFGTFAMMEGVHPDITWAKLEAMAQGAELASQRLY